MPRKKTNSAAPAAPAPAHAELGTKLLFERVGAARRSEVPPEVLAGLNAGELETRNLVEALVVDFEVLLRSAVPEAAAEAAELRFDEGIAARMGRAGRLLLERLGPSGYARLVRHSSDTVRGWAAYLLSGVAEMPLSDRLTAIEPLADDPHFGVREWAWLALRPHIAADPAGAVKLLSGWVAHRSVNRRRFAVEITRPRGVWCGHITELKTQPVLGLPLLEPVRSDSAKYVQDSVANWLNDASKSRPDWVREVCRRWLAESRTEATARICQRAQRSLPAEPKRKAAAGKKPAGK